MPYSPDQLETDVGYLTSLPQWQDEAQRPQFIRDVASKARTDADPDTHRQLVGELWNRAKGGVVEQGADFVQRSAGEVLKSIPAAPAAGLLAASDTAGATESGSGTRLMRGAADMADAVVQRVKQNPVSTLFPMAGVSGRVMDAVLPDRQAARDNTLDSLRQDLDAGIHPAGLERWLSGDDEPDEETKPWVQALTRGIATRAVAADHMGKPSPEKINAWLKSDRNPAFLDSDTPGVPGPRALLADYLVTRDPSSWDAFKARVSETDSQYTTRLQRFASEAPEFTPTVGAAPKDSLAQEMLTRTADMQTSPMDLASAVLPVLRSVKILKAAHAGVKGQTLLRRGAEDAAKEFGQEAVTEMVSDPNASTAQILEAGAMGGIGQGVVSAPAAIAGRLLRPATSIEPPASSNDNLPPARSATRSVAGGPNQTATPTGTPQTPGAPTASPQMGGAAPAPVSPLIGIAQRAGAVDVDPLLPESTGELTAEDVADLEAANPPLPPTPTPTLPPPQTQTQGVGGGVRGGEGVSETLPTVANPDPAQTITGSNVQTGTEMPVPPPTAEAGAGAGAPSSVVPPSGGPVETEVPDGGLNKLRDSLARMPQKAPYDAAVGTMSKDEAQSRQKSGLLSTEGEALNNEMVDWANPTSETAFTYRKQKGEQAYEQKRQEVSERASQWRSKAQDAAFLSQRLDLKTRIAESKPAPNPAPSPKNQEPGLTNLIVKRDLESGFMTTAGADALLDLAHRAFAAGQTFVQWSKTMLQRFGEAVRQWLAGVWDHAKRSSQTGAVNFTGRLGEQLQRAASQQPRAKAGGGANQALPRGSRTEPPVEADNLRESRSQFARPEQAERMYEPQGNEVMLAEASEWLATVDDATAVQQLESGLPPAGLRTDHLPALAERIIQRVLKATTDKSEIVRMHAETLLDRAGIAWQNIVTRQAGRGLQQVDAANQRLGAIAPVLALKQMLVQKATKVIDARFDGGAEGVTEKIKAVVTKADAQAGETLAGQLDDATSSGNDPRIADLEARLKELRTQMTAGDAAMQQTTSTWQKIMNLLNAASKRKSSMLNGARSKLSALREAALKRKAQRRSEGRLNANPVEDFADDAIIGAALLAEGIVEFANWSQAMIREIGARSSTELKELYAAASQQYHDALAEQQKRPSALISRDSPALTRLLDKLRRKLYPGMRWSAIFSELPDTQKGRQREIYKRLLEDEKLKDLTAEERLQLTNELDKAWLRERRKVFMRELEKAGVLGEVKPKDREKVKAAAPRLLRLMNLGLLNSEMFREALAKEYGLKVIDAATAAELRALGERIQQAPEGLPRRKLEQQLVERLQSLAGTTLFQVIDSWWTASVLSGWRTQADIGLSLANGIEDVGLGSIVTALRTGNKDVAIRGLASLFGRIPSAFMEAVDHVRTGNKALMRNFELEAKQALEGGNRLASDVGAQMWRDGGWRKVPGGFMIFYGRLMTALDHVNSASTREGAKAMALARHPELYQKALRISDADRQAARQQARLELTGGAMPVTQQERLEETARVREILDQGIPAEVLAEATEIGRAAALQGEPTGLGGALLDMVLSAVSVVSRKAESISKRPGLDAKSQQVLKLLQGAAPLARAITGTKFARTVAHSLNRTASYVPGLGAYAVGQQGRTGAFGDILAAKQVIGTLVGIALYLAFDDDDDEKGIEDSWKDKTPQQKAQLYAQGKQPLTIWQRDTKGRVRSYNYQQWGIAGIVNTVAAMLKQKDSEDGTLNVLMSSITQGALSFTDKAQLQGLQTVFGENFRSSDPAGGIAASLNKWAAQTVGGMVPRLVKDIDMVTSPELRSSREWWQKWAKEVPMLRQLSSGKRIDILGGDILLGRGPLSRVTMLGTADPIYRILGRLNEKDVWLPDPSTGVRIVKLSDGTRRNMTDAEKDRYQRLTGAAYRDYLEEQGARLLTLDPEAAQEEISRVTKRHRDRAAYQATH